MSAKWRVGIDIGGTFTDVVAISPESGAMRLAKVRSRTEEPLAALTDALGAVDLDWTDVGTLVHGTTMVTNALVESRLADVALVATRGFGDVLDIARASRQTLYRLDVPPRSTPDVAEERRFEVAGRMDPAGTEVEKLDAASMSGLAAQIRASGAKAVAVSLLHAYANPLHEQAVAQVLADAFDFVSLSHEISPEAREFERTATTVVNASLMPMVSGYMDRLTKRVPPSVTVRLFHSAGGMTSPAHVRERPLSLALSGPAAGASGAAAVAGELGLERAISFDMGGTTTDVCLILDGQVEISSDRRIAGRPIRQPIAAIETIGAGGGSIISLRSGGLFVGPESAGADPGPACYGFGGDRATIADADLVLGYLDHERPLAGKIRLDPEAARRALAPLAESLSLNVEAAAGGISQVAHATMARAVRRVSVERGIDTRQCALIAFGGAGPMHACGLADATQIDTIVVPAASGGFSALGCVTAKASFSHQQTVRLASRSWCPDLFHRLRSEITGKARDPLLEVGHSPDAIRIEEVALVRYAGQSGTAEVPVAAGDGRAEIDHAFHAAHERLYGFSTGEDWIVESYRVSARESAERPVVDGTNAAGPHGALADATCWFSDLGACQTPRLWRSSLEPGKVFKGPMLILDDWSTTVVDFGFEVSATPAGHLVLRRRAV